MPETDARSLRVPLSPEVHDELAAQALRLGVSAAVLARRAIEDRLRALEREQVAQEITAYAEAMAGTEFDFDPAVSAAGTEVWANDDDEWDEADGAPPEVTAASAEPDAR